MSDEQQAAYYGTRRKRNIQLISDWNNSNNRIGINWSGSRETTESEYENNDYDEQECYSNADEQESYKNEKDGQDSDDENETIGKKAVNLVKLKEKLQPVETEKVTIYLDKGLLEILKMLKEEKRISSYSKAVNDALEEYLRA